MIITFTTLINYRLNPQLDLLANLRLQDILLIRRHRLPSSYIVRKRWFGIFVRGQDNQCWRMGGLDR